MPTTVRVGLPLAAWSTAWLLPTTQDPNYPAVNLKSGERPFQSFRTGATSTQSIVIDYRTSGASVSRNAWLLVHSTALQFSIDSDTLSTFNSVGGTTPQYASGTKTIPNHVNGRYGYLLQAGQTRTSQFDRLTLPSQVPTDPTASYFAIGGLIPVFLEAVPFDPPWEPELGRRDAAEFDGSGNWAAESQTDDPITILRMPLQANVNMDAVGAADNLRLWMTLLHQVATAGIAVISLSDNDPTQAWVMRRADLERFWKLGPLATSQAELEEVIGGEHATYANDAPEDYDMTGDARIQRDSATQISLQYGTIPLQVSGVWGRRQVTTPVTISNGGLSASTLYYVYAYDNAGVLTLFLSASGHAVDTASGVETLSGNASRTLVGMIRTNASSQFVDTEAQRFVASWFNRKSKRGLGFFTANRTTASGSFVELNTEIRVEFLCWGDQTVRLAWNGLVSHDSAGSSRGPATFVGIDGVGTNEEMGGTWHMAMVTGSFNQLSASVPKLLAEGYHYATLAGATVISGTSTWQGNAVTNQRCSVSVEIWG